jgi:hypothetical protein
MEMLMACFSSSTTRGNESEPVSISPPIDYRREAKEAHALQAWGECHQSNDYSFVAGVSNYSPTQRIGLYYKGVLISGNEPT